MAEQDPPRPTPKDALVRELERVMRLTHERRNNPILAGASSAWPNGRDGACA